MNKIKLSIIIPLYNQEELIIKALESIPYREDVEVIVIDDCSTDKGISKIFQYMVEFTRKDIVVVYNEENMGVGHTINKGIRACRGEYWCILCSDDYYLDDIGKLIDELDGTDLVYYDLKMNDGRRLNLNEESKLIQVGATKAHRTDFTRGIERSDKRIGGDKDYYMEVLSKGPTEKFTNLLLYHWNHPRKGSLMEELCKEAKNNGSL